MTLEFRCSAASSGDDEQMIGTAPTGSAFLFVEYAGAWGRDAVAEAPLPESLRSAVAAAPGLSVHVIRRHGRVESDGVQVFTATADLAGVSVEGRRLSGLDEVADLTLSTLAAGGSLGLDPVSHPLWLVCTNGKRDRCCAEIGRPVAAALSERWPESTWEVNHLGGHRFAGTLLALPSGVVLGRLCAADAVEACSGVLSGDVDGAVLRGRVGLPGAAQFAQAALARQLGVRLSEVGVREVNSAGASSRVHLVAGGEDHHVQVTSEPAPPRRQSCGAPDLKGGTTYVLVGER